MQIDDLPDLLLVEVASFLRKECRALWAVSMSAPSEHWSTSSVVSGKGKQILTLQRENWQKEWQEFEFLNFHLQQWDLRSGIALSLSDDDLKAVLICIGAATNVRSMYLSVTDLGGDNRLTGRGLEPLSGSTALRRIDISLVGRYAGRSIVCPHERARYQSVNCSLELGEVLPVLHSIVESNGNKLRHIQFPKKWRDVKHESLNRFIARYNDMLAMTVHNCCQCNATACKPEHCIGICHSLLIFLAAPAIRESDYRYGVQTDTCYGCMKNFCVDDDGTCRMRRNWEDNSFDYCPSCAKYFCKSCSEISYCERCDKAISCGDCMKDIWFDRDGYSFCSEYCCNESNDSEFDY